MQPKIQFNSGNLSLKALAPKSPTAQFEELNYSALAMQPKSQFSSGNLSHKASAAKSPTAQFKKLNCSTQARQPRNQFSSGIQLAEPQQLSFEEINCSTAQLRPGSPGANSAQAFSPQSLSSIILKSSTAQPRRSIQAMQPRSQFGSCRTSAKSTSRVESGEIKNEYSLGKRLHMSGVPSLKKKKTTTTTRSKQRYVREIIHQRKEPRVKKVSGPQWGYLVLQNSLRRGTLLPPRR